MALHGVMTATSDAQPQGIPNYEDDDFARWYSETWPRTLRAVAVYIGDREAAQDIAAEAFLRACERWRTPTRPDQPTSWVLVTALNLAKRRGRVPLVRRRVDWAIDRSAPENTTPDVELWEAVRKLPRRQREAVVLRYAADLTERSVAESMHITPGAVAAILSSAKKNLRSTLGESEICRER